ncbi:MAG: Gfo/Idh/MocA family oxidoreductase [Cyanobacteria bacterium P01_D01_bin.1]
MSKSICKLGLIGCGSIAQAVHLNILLRLPMVEVVAFAEPDFQRRTAVEKRVPGAIAYTDYRELLEHPDLEGVVICLPSAMHAEVAIAALQQGKHIYLEKPIAISTPEAEAVIAAWQQADAVSNVVGMIGFNYRFNPLYTAAKQVIQSGQLGQLVSARAVFSYPLGTAPPWKRKRVSGGGILLDLALHDVDLARFLFNAEIDAVSAELQSHGYEDDTAAIQLRLNGGMLIQIFTSMSTIDEARWEIYGQQGKLTADRYRETAIELTLPQRPYSRRSQLGTSVRAAVRALNLQKILSPTLEPSYQQALTQFATAIQSGQAVSPDLQDGLRALTIIEAAETAARTGKTVSLAAQPTLTDHRSTSPVA